GLGVQGFAGAGVAAIPLASFLLQSLEGGNGTVRKLPEQVGVVLWITRLNFRRFCRRLPAGCQSAYCRPFPAFRRTGRYTRLVVAELPRSRLVHRGIVQPPVLGVVPALVHLLSCA